MSDFNGFKVKDGIAVCDRCECDDFHFRRVIPHVYEVIARCKQCGLEHTISDFYRTAPVDEDYRDTEKQTVLQNLAAKIDEMLAGDEEEKAAAMEMLTELAEEK